MKIDVRGIDIERDGASVIPTQDSRVAQMNGHLIPLSSRDRRVYQWILAQLTAAIRSPILLRKHVPPFLQLTRNKVLEGLVRVGLLFIMAADKAIRTIHNSIDPGIQVLIFPTANHQSTSRLVSFSHLSPCLSK